MSALVAIGDGEKVEADIMELEMDKDRALVRFVIKRKADDPEFEYVPLSSLHPHPSNPYNQRKRPLLKPLSACSTDSSPNTNTLSESESKDSAITASINKDALLEDLEREMRLCLDDASKYQREIDEILEKKRVLEINRAKLEAYKEAHAQFEQLKSCDYYYNSV